MSPRTLRHLTASLGLAALLLAPTGARAWWNGEWKGRKQLRLDTSAAGANVTEPIGGVPVLIRLHLGNFHFDKAAENGADLRFLAQDDATPLAFHVEKYDGLLGEALIWVLVPDLKPGAQTAIWLYYGNPKAPPAEDPKGTYDTGTALVYHFSEKGEPPRDSTKWGNQASTAAGSTDAGIIGRALRLDGTATVTVPAGPSIAWAPGGRMTWSAWLKPAEEGSTGLVFARRDGANAFVVGLDGGKPYVELSGPEGPVRAAGAGILTAAWHHLAVTVGEEAVLYVDGAPTAKVKAALPALGTPAVVGGDAPGARVQLPAGRPATAPPVPLTGFHGELDELQLASVERTAGFVRASAISQGSDPGRFLTAGQDEESGGFETGYFAILIQSVTLDGWIVIGLLAIMSLVSIWVMVEKSGYLAATEKANRRFEDAFAEASGDLPGLVAASAGGTPLGPEKHLKQSSLHRLFLIAAREVRKRTSTHRPLSGEAIESIRASLDAGLVRENQALSRLMVLLTIAISGGPFLGLLGTVVGVMITFAAIAAAGDVNVNAIAPGIAAALVATVAGLAVAIPALFAYNWLLTRSRDVTATMQVFVDELVTRIAESYADGAAEAAAEAQRPHRPTAVAGE